MKRNNNIYTVYYLGGEWLAHDVAVTSAYPTGGGKRASMTGELMSIGRDRGRMQGQLRKYIKAYKSLCDPWNRPQASLSRLPFPSLSCLPSRTSCALLT